MTWVFIVLLVIVALLIALMLLKLKVIIYYFHGNDNDELTITLKALFGLIKYKINIPVIKIAEDSPSLVVETETQAEVGQEEKDLKSDKKKVEPEEMLQSLQDMQSLLKHVVGFYKIIRKLLSKMTITEFKWETVVGIGDAAYTGMLTGAFWTVKGGIIGLVSSLMKMKTIPRVMITPSFNHPISQTAFQCMIQFRIGHAIFASFKLLKYWKGGKPHFKTKPLSHLSDKTKSV